MVITLLPTEKVLQRSAHPEGFLMTGTMIENIMTVHSEAHAKVGDIIWLDLDVRSARDFGGANVVKNYEENYGDAPLNDPSGTFFTFDCCVPANNIPYANNQQICRDFARKHGAGIYDVNAGIGSHVYIEEGIALPGKTVVGTDSHLNILGAVGAFGQGMGYQDIAFAFRTGRTWFEVPATMKIMLEGKLPEECTPKDLTLFLVGKLGSGGALGRAVEFCGETIDTLPLSGRITLASMATEMGAIIALIPPNDEITGYCRERGVQRVESFDPVYADDHAGYVEELEFNIGDIGPQIASPPGPDNVTAVAGMEPVDVDSVFIGSCTNGSYDDLKAVANYVQGKKVSEKVMAKIVPATRNVYERLLKEGLLADLFDAGFIITAPGCGGCASGQVGMTGKGEVQISTSNRNFPGKQGEGMTYLASPVTAAAAAIAGRMGPGVLEEMSL